MRKVSGDDRSMPGKKKRDSLFTDQQIRVLISTIEKARKKYKNQEELALALGLTQPSLSNLLHGKWKPGLGTAQAVAHLEGVTLEELIGPVRPTSGAVLPAPAGPRFPNLEVCIRFHDGTKTWSAWTLAAAREGYFGPDDLPAPQWAPKLDALEDSLKRARK